MKLTQILIIDDYYTTVGGVEAYEGIIPEHLIPYVLEARRKIEDDFSPFRDFDPQTGKIVLKGTMEARCWFSTVISNANNLQKLN